MRKQPHILDHIVLNMFGIFKMILTDGHLG